MQLKFDSGKYQIWYHDKCFLKRNPLVHTTQIENLESIGEEDREGFILEIYSSDRSNLKRKQDSGRGVWSRWANMPKMFQRNRNVELADQNI
jgi:hypothetical protein